MRKFSSQAVVLALVAGLGLTADRVRPGARCFRPGWRSRTAHGLPGAGLPRRGRGLRRGRLRPNPTTADRGVLLPRQQLRQPVPADGRGEAGQRRPARPRRSRTTRRPPKHREQTPANSRRSALQYLANAYGSDKLNDPAQSEPVVQQLIQMDPKEPVNYFALSRIYEDSGDYENAEATLVKAREMKARRPGRLHDPRRATTTGRASSTRAWKRSRPAPTREPNNPEAFYTMATYYWDKAYRDFSLSDAEKDEVRAARASRPSTRRSSSTTGLHGGARLQEPAAPRPGEPRTESRASAGAAAGKRPSFSNRAEEIRKQNARARGAAPAGTSGRSE